MRKIVTLTAAAAIVAAVMGFGGAAWAASPTFTSGTTGSGATASQTPGGIELFTPDGTVGDAFVRILIPGGVAVEDILEVTYTGELLDVGSNPSTFSPEVVLNVDADGDTLDPDGNGDGVEGNFPDWHLSGGFLGDPAQLGFVSNPADRGDNWLSLDGVSLGVVDGGPVVRTAIDDVGGSGEDASGWFLPGATRALGDFAALPYQPDFTQLLADLPGVTVDTDVDTTDLVGSIDLIIGGSSNFDGNRFLISSVTVNLDGEETTLNLRGLVKEITSGPCVSDPTNSELVCESDDLPSLGFVKVVDGIDNGSFEDDACGAAFCTLGGPGGLTDWTIGGAGIDLITTFWTDHADGTQSLDMSAGNAGSISQTLTTEAGVNYEVRFSLAGNFAGGGNIKDLRVSVDTGSPPTDYQFDISSDCGGVCSAANMGWTAKTYTFTADDADAILTFTSLTATNGGPALDDVMLFEEELDEIAVAVLAPATASIHYDFKITVDTTGLTDPVVIDTVPAEWTVTHIDEAPVGPDNNSNFDENFTDVDIGVGCGGFQAGLGVGGDVTVSRGGSSRKNKCSSDTDIVWDMDTNEEDMIRVDLQSRGPKKNGKFKPTFCGPLFLNKGAVLTADGNFVQETPPLVVASMFDLNGGGIVADGSGDEDGDGATDIDEVRILKTDPCDSDTDNDGVLDGVDSCPLEGPPNTGVGETLGTDGCIIPPV